MASKYALYFRAVYIPLILNFSAIDAGIKIRPNSTDLEILGPSFAERWSTFFANAPDKPVMFMGSFAA